jgi:rsbT co-antagonist protein RsbR
MTEGPSRTYAILKKHARDIHADWMSELADGLQLDRRITEAELSAQTREFLALLQTAVASDGMTNLEGAPWAPVREFLESISRSRAQQGFSSDETAAFVFSLKKPLFELLRKDFGKNPAVLAEETWNISELLDKLGLHTVKSFQKAREAVINRQQEELLELSTPVVKLWDGILALPMIGTLDSARTQVVMESLL